MKLINKTFTGNRFFAAGYHLLDSAEALLQEAPKDPRDYGKGWYLKNLMKMERLLDALRPSHIDVGRKNFDKYDKREQAIRRRIGQYADTLDPELKRSIVFAMTNYEEQVESLPGGRQSKP